MESAWCYVAAWMGGQLGKERIRVYVWLSGFTGYILIQHEKLKKKHETLMSAQRDPNQTHDLQNCKITHPCCLKPLRVWRFVSTAIGH